MSARGKRKPAEPPSLEEILAELERNAAQAEAGALTRREWEEHWGVSKERARKLIRAALEQGRMTATNVLRDCLMRPGYRSRTTVYKFVGRGAA